MIITTGLIRTSREFETLAFWDANNILLIPLYQLLNFVEDLFGILAKENTVRILILRNKDIEGHVEDYWKYAVPGNVGHHVSSTDKKCGTWYEEINVQNVGRERGSCNKFCSCHCAQRIWEGNK